jgi:hypothetical protein
LQAGRYRMISGRPRRPYSLDPTLDSNYIVPSMAPISDGKPHKQLSGIDICGRVEIDKDIMVMHQNVFSEASGLLRQRCRGAANFRAGGGIHEN